MKITKFGHCCLLIEDKGVRLLTDPGSYSTVPTELSNIDIILITHEHQDHLHVESLKKVLEKSPKAKIITNKSVAAILEREHILYYKTISDSERDESLGILIEGYGEKHAVIYQELGAVENTGYFLNGRFFYPGDAFYNPKREVEILALPVVGPWCKISEAIDYALEIKPKVCFPVHDGILKIPSLVHFAPNTVLTPRGIKFQVLELNQETEF